MDDLAGDTGWRGSREGWLQAAYEALIDGGVDSVKIMTLAARLKLSRTSFYWFFKDRADVLDALRARWVEATTVPLVSACREYAESGPEAMLNLLASFLSGRFDARFEFAARSWGLQDAAMAAAVGAADAERLDALAAMLGRWGHDAQDADVRARTVYLVQIGYISMRSDEPLETRLSRIPNYVEIYTGKRPAPREMARFRARLGLEP
ncbi:TetR/AcrR family transcriptional regulator [Rhodobacter sp. NSM]|uniref:TetR/AcrR family transcriptional regulator n=1 Tax=Rhodobacter sp. NSM TaxID=3457501 RepID=UPI003FD0F72A